MPTAAQEEQQNMSQKMLTAEIMATKQHDLLQSMTIQQQQIFTDNMASLKWLNAFPHGAYNRLSDQQVAANLNILQLRSKTSGPICQVCGNVNSINEHETCRGCKIFSQQTHSRHNYIRDKIIINAAKDQRNIVQKEPLIYGNTPNPPNMQRADFSILPKTGQPQHHHYYGMFDIMTKVVFSVHASNAREASRIQAQLEGIVDPIKICRKEIQASLHLGVAFKDRKYAAAKAAGIKLTPLLISTGGSLHTTTYKFIKKTFPDNTLREKVLTDISVALARGRANLYNDIPVVVDAPEDIQI